MAYKPTEKEVDVMLAADPTTRVTYAIRRFADTGKLYGFEAGDNVMVNSHGGNDYLALWPHPSFADRLRSLYGAGVEIVHYSTRTLRQLFDNAPELTGISLFPTETRGGVPMPLEELFARLRDERARFGS